MILLVIKSPGLDSLSAEHIKFAGPKICILMSMMISSIFTHGFIPSSLMELVIVPVIKNKNKRINDKCNYLPISLSIARRSLKWHYLVA